MGCSSNCNKFHATEDDGSCEYDSDAVQLVYPEGEITESVTWTKDNTYILTGRVVVPNGDDVNIEDVRNITTRITFLPINNDENLLHLNLLFLQQQLIK